MDTKTTEENELLEKFAMGEMPHNPLSEAIYECIEKIDYEGGDSMNWKSGGDGDNGENLMACLDVMLLRKDNPISSLLHQSRTELMRKVVGRVPKRDFNIISDHIYEYYRGQDAAHFALLKLAEEENITL